MPRNHLSTLTALLSLYQGFRTRASGQILEQRSGPVNPHRSDIFLGTAYSPASNNSKFEVGLKWGFVKGMGSGFIAGVV